MSEGNDEGAKWILANPLAYGELIGHSFIHAPSIY